MEAGLAGDTQSSVRFVCRTRLSSPAKRRVPAGIILGNARPFGFRLSEVNLKLSQLIAACLCFSASIATTAQDSSPEAKLTDNPIYQKQCAKCHGRDAKGRHFLGSSLISEKLAAANKNDVNHIINNGKGLMPKYTRKLTPSEIETLVDQIDALNQK